MKTNSFFKPLWLAICLMLVYSNTFAQNLLSSSDMEAKGSWSTSFLNSTAGDEPTATWGYTADKPTQGTAGSLRLDKDNAQATSQFAIYQKVTLTAGNEYELNAAFKVVNQASYKDSWFEAFVGKTAPVDGQEYGSENGTQIASFSYWGNPSSWDGTLVTNANGTKSFTATESGDYYVVIKCGANGGGKFELLLDNVTFEVKTKPVAEFAADQRSGFAPMQVKFTNSSTRATSYQWSFGDGQTSTEASPTHTYTAIGKYTVKLTVKNDKGETDILEKANYIEVKAIPTLPDGGKLVGSNMEDASKWSISTLTSPEGSHPTATWNYQPTIPKAGQGGALRVEGTASNSVVQYAIYQKVSLDANKKYVFDGAFKDITDNLNHFFIEVFISKDLFPADGSDFGSGEGVTQIASFGIWDDNSVYKKLDGTFQAHTSPVDFIPATTGDYYFILKMGVNDWEGKALGFDMLIDQLSLTEVRTKPYTSFTAENSQGFAPLEVTFKNTSLFGTTYQWNLGDGTVFETSESEFKHTYANVGSYTVTLKGSNEKGDSIMVKENFISVNNRPELPKGEKLYGGNMESKGFWYTANIGAAVKVQQTWDYRDNIPTGGEGGALRLQATVKNAGSNIALYQPVELNKDSVYVFSALYKDLGTSDHLWAQVYISQDKPTDDKDLSVEEKNTLGQLNTWTDSQIVGYDGAFEDKAVMGSEFAEQGGELLTFAPATSGTYYFILKIGNTDWESHDYVMDIVLDNLSLKETTPYAKPKADFDSDKQSGEAPLSIIFFSASENAETWHWDFGDGNTSTEEMPVHIYTKGGKYTVSLTVTSGSRSDILVKTDYITVTGGASIEENGDESYTIKVEAGVISIESASTIENVVIYNLRGEIVQSTNANTNIFTSNGLNKGMYLLKVNNSIHKVLVK